MPLGVEPERQNRHVRRLMKRLIVNSIFATYGSIIVPTRRTRSHDCSREKANRCFRVCSFVVVVDTGTVATFHFVDKTIKLNK
jgi:hypothetical protein